MPNAERIAPVDTYNNRLRMDRPDRAKEGGESAMAGRVRMSRALLQTRTIGMESDAA